MRISAKPKLLYFVTEDWYFCSHRLPLAIAARDAGYDVAAVTFVNNHGDTIRRAGIRLIPFKLSRRGMNVLSELATLVRLIALYRKERPDLVHHVAMKPVLYGSLAARVSGVSRVLNALPGLGYVFTSDKPKARLLRLILGMAFRKLLSNGSSLLILQNQDDCATFGDKGFINQGRIRLILGSGVDTAVFIPSPEPPGVPVVALASRMLWAKGIKEFVEAARLLKEKGIEARFALVGDTDDQNPSAIPKEQLTAWDKEGAIEWWGHRQDMAHVFSQCHIVCLPSFYGEGVPKVLIEAAASGRPIVTTDMPGCREIVRHGVNGFHVAARKAGDLAEKIQALVESPELRQKMGKQGRDIAVNEFAVEKVVSQTMALYKELLPQ